MHWKVFGQRRAAAAQQRRSRTPLTTALIRSAGTQNEPLERCRQNLQSDSLELTFRTLSNGSTHRTGYGRFENAINFQSSDATSGSSATVCYFWRSKNSAWLESCAFGLSHLLGCRRSAEKVSPEPLGTALCTIAFYVKRSPMLFLSLPILAAKTPVSGRRHNLAGDAYGLMA